MNLSNLKGHLPQVVFNQLQETCDKFQINTHARLAHFLGQCDHESAGFTHTTENLNYSEEALPRIFPSHFKPPVKAGDYARQPEKIANHIYADRLGNGNEASGDGWKQRGMGYIQLTGKELQEGFFAFTNIPADTDPADIGAKYPLLSAAYFWDLKNLNPVADGGVTEQVITEVTKRVNGGTLGLKERGELTEKYYGLLGKEAAATAAM